ncbi:MAG: MurT ligase domain-containing protein [Thermacetogeniaceae bacterium]|jgi:UDP-N-acetylmuramyl tripeptide synthase
MIAWFRLNLALLTARLVAAACRLFHYPGTSLPGVVALKVCPDAVNLMTPAYERVLAVTGTNGKTTTANLLADFLRAAGCTVAHNAMGANMLPGVATALFRDRQFRGRPRSRIALLEVDEGSVGKVFAAARPELVIVTNYFRDQLDRYWELERTTALLREAVAGLPRVTLVLNADDPLVAVVGQGQAQVRYFGVLKESRPVIPPISYETREGRFCQRCGTALTYNYFHFGQLGDYFCSNCGFRRPELDYAARGISEDELLRMSVSIRVASASALKTDAGVAAPPGGAVSLRQPGRGTRFSGSAAPEGERRELQLTAPLRGFYNVYNILAATAAAQELGVGDQVIQSAARSYKPATGRMEDFLFAGRRCTLALIKNPVGANEVLKTLIQTVGAKALVIAINDLAADGRDVSWLWDTDFACLADPSVNRVICAGLRAADFAVCLKYAGVPLERIEVAPERPASLRRLAAQQADKLYVLATYTNLFDYARLLGRLGRVVERRAH